MSSDPLKKYIGKSIDKILKDFPDKTVRILFPHMAYTQDYSKDRINVVATHGLISKIWLG
jgi:hypothetical protein